MKKLFILLTFVTSLLTARGQTEKGTVYLGGNLGFNITTNQSGSAYSKVTQFSLNPTIGYFVGSKWAIGITPMYQYVKDSLANYSPYYDQPGFSTAVSKNQYLGLGVNLRRYFMISSQFAFYPQLNGSYAHSIGNGSYSNHYYTINVSPNFAFFPTKKIGVVLSYGYLGYLRQSGRNKIYIADGSNLIGKSTSFGFNVNDGLSLGINYHFTK